jgi:hypothetical protein
MPVLGERVRGSKTERMETRKVHKKPKRLEAVFSTATAGPSGINATAGPSKRREYAGERPPAIPKTKGRKPISPKTLDRLHHEVEAEVDPVLDDAFLEVERWQGKKRMANRMVEALEQYRYDLLRERGLYL